MKVNTLLVFFIWNVFYLECFLFGMFLEELQKGVETFSQEIKHFADVSLGSERIQDHYTSISKFSNDQIDGSALAKELSESLGRKTNLAKQILQLKSKIVDGYKGQREVRALESCCTYDDRNASFINRYNDKIDVHGFCEKTISTNIHVLRKDKILRELKNVYPLMKGQTRSIYYGAVDGYSLTYPAISEQSKAEECKSFDPRFQQWFKNTKDEGKDIVLVVDFTENRKNYEQRIRTTINHILDKLSPKDRITMRLMYGNPVDLYPPQQRQCMGSLTEATLLTINTLREFINTSSVSGADPRYKVMIENSLRIFNFSSPRGTYILFFVTCEKKIIFVSSGIHTDLEYDIKRTMENERSLFGCKIFVTFIVVKSLEGEDLDFHQRLPSIGCNVVSTLIETSQGQLIQIDTDISNEIKDKVASIDSEQIIVESGEDDIQYTMPYGGNILFGSLMDACTRVVDREKILRGVLCVSFITNELFSSSIEFPQNHLLYRFIVDTSGSTYIHPLYPVSTSSMINSPRLDIKLFERSSEFQSIYDSITRAEDGTKSFLMNASVSRGAHGARFELRNYTYHWRKVQYSMFVVGVVTSLSTQRTVKLNIESLGGREFYHRIDLWDFGNSSIYQFCKQQKQTISKAVSTIKLVPDLFKTESTYSEEESEESVKCLMKYFDKEVKCTPDIFKSNEVRNKIRESVVTSHIMDTIWKNDTSPNSHYVMAKYFATQSGLMRVYPGHNLHPNYDPRHRAWYTTALELKDKIQFTPPYVDLFTGTNVLTITKTIFKGTVSDNQPYGVLGMDFNLPYIELLLKKKIPECGNSSKRGHCVLLDTNGYIIYHPKFKNMTEIADIHITVLEPRISEHLHKMQYMKKDKCIKYQTDDAIIQWFYSLDHTPDVVEVTTETCLKYWLLRINQTNVFLLYIDEILSENQCPKTCRCKEQGDCVESDNRANCDCPCRDHSYCISELNQRNTTLLCKPPITRNFFNPDWCEKAPKKCENIEFKDCYEPQCKMFKDLEGCQYRIGCEWCSQFPNDSNVPEPHCEYKDKCFFTPHVPIPTSKLTNGEIAAIVISSCIVLIAIRLFQWVKEKKSGKEKNKRKKNKENKDIIPNHNADHGNEVLSV